MHLVPFKKFYTVASRNCILSNTGKAIFIFSANNLAGLAYPSACSPSNIQHGFCVTVDTCYVNSDIFTVDMFLSSFPMGRTEPTVQDSVNEADHSPSAQIDEPLAPKAPEESVPAGPSASTPLPSPRYLEEI
jgi:hypothetical protein